ncbi:NF-kappa-B inhibitor beta [Galendromus occidentalis]|uniref:NF-kappa-B inhibitor beta n=1 Tax=Galendromus occidentalis TaxID=34638 RepID=A0AAJ6VX32_9ACAR|nr:NF-kappa-B inhibitor beta [Galendromus occidentalis]
MERFTKLQDQQEAPDSGYLSELQSSSDVASSALSIAAPQAAEPSGDSGINLDYSRSQSSEAWKEIYKQDDNGDTQLHIRLATVDHENRKQLPGVLLEYLRATPHPDLLEITNDWGQTALHVACEHEDVTCARMLVCAGAIANRADSMLYTPLHIASGKGNLMLLKALVDPITTEEVSDLGLTLYGVSPSAPRTKLAEISSLCSRGMTPMHLAITSGNRQVLQELLNLAIDFDTRELLEGRTALHLAADLRRPDMLRLLLEYGAAVDGTDYSGRTALARVLQQRPIQACEELDLMDSILRAHGAQEPEADDMESDPDDDDEDERHQCSFQECSKVACC